MCVGSICGLVVSHTNATVHRVELHAAQMVLWYTYVEITCGWHSLHF